MTSSLWSQLDRPPETAAVRPLDGVRVVEAASYVSGPFAGLALAQLGAHVVKVEPPTGDPLRKFGLTHSGMSALYTNLNHGKRSVVLDLKDDTDRAAMNDLLADADVFLQNWRPGIAESLGLGYEEVRRGNDGLVYVAITGFGPTGPKLGRPVFDTSIQAATGLAAFESGQAEPAMVRSLVADKTTAMMAVQGVLAALLSRSRTGKGGRVDLAMLDVMAYFNFPDVCQDRTFLDAPDRDLVKGRANVVRTSDGYVAVSPVSGRQLAAAVAAVGHPEWKDELKAAPSPTALIDRLVELLERVTVERTSEEWEKVFLDHDVPATAVLTVDGHFADPQTVHNGLYGTSDSPSGPVRRVRYPALLDGESLPEVPPTEALPTVQSSSP